MINVNPRRHIGRFFYCLISMAFMISAVRAAAPAITTGPTMTTISDVVYRANGQPASGTIVVSWPAFNTADNKPVAAGELSIAIGAEGTVNFALVPNEGSDPGGTFYKAVYKLTDGTTFIEYWVVPATSPTTIAAIRASVVPRQVGAQFVNRNYVDTAVASTHQQVVHKSGVESIDGTKTFAASPEVPAPASGVSAVNRDYVSGAISAISGGFVDKSGDTMAGPLTVPDDPTAPGHVTNRHYVDLQVSDMIAGLTLKLGRVGDTPISLGGVRYANQFASPGSPLSAQIAAACADLAGAPGRIILSAGMSTGSAVATLPDNCMIADERQTGGMNSAGAPASYTTNHSKGINYYNRWTAANNSNKTFTTLNLFTEAAAGGQNISGNKSNYIQSFNILQTRTPGQAEVGVFALSQLSMGDAFGIQGVVDTSGGNEAGIGDETKAPVRATLRQHGAVFTGTITGISGNVLTYGSASNADYLGEQRFLINTSANVYSTGTATTVAASATITEGGGADWEGATASGILDANSLPRFAFALDHDAGNPNNNASSTTLKYVTPITAVPAAGATATLRNAWPSLVTGSTNTYKIYKGSVVTAVDLAANTITVSDATSFAIGDTIELPLDNRYAGIGMFVSTAQKIGASGLGTSGVTVTNGGTTAATRLNTGFQLIGNAATTFQQDSYTIAPGRAFYFNGPAPPIGVFLSDQLSGVGQDTGLVIWLSMNRRAALGGTANLSYQNTSDSWLLGAGNLNVLRVRSNEIAVGIGSTVTSGTALTVTPAGTDKAVVINGNTTGSILDVQSAGGTRLLVNATQSVFNNGLDVKGFSDNQVTQKWQVTGSSGKANFNGGVCLDSAQTVCEISGTGAPGGACVTGSTYKRTDGGTATTLYVCESSAWVTVGGAGGSSTWNGITNPSGAQSLTMAANTSTWTWNATTGSSDLVKLVDTSSNTGTGHILSVETAASSNAKPFQVKSRGTTAFEINESGTVTALTGVTTSSGLVLQAGGTLTLKGRDDWFAPVAINGADFSGSSATANNATVRGGDATSSSGSTTAGNLVLRSGGVSSASGTPGSLQIAQTFLKDTTVTSGFLQCFKAAAAMTVGDCGNSALNSVGVATSSSNTNPVIVQFQGVATLQFDGTFSPSAGWFACSSATTGGKVIVQSGACAAGRQVGIVAQNGSSITSGKVFLQAR